MNFLNVLVLCISSCLSIFTYFRKLSHIFTTNLNAKNPVVKIRPGFALQFISLFCQDLHRLLQLIVLLLRYHHFIGYSRIQFHLHVWRNADSVDVVAVWRVVLGDGQLHGGRSSGQYLCRRSECPPGYRCHNL